jgi:hypothetical protein
MPVESVPRTRLDIMSDTGVWSAIAEGAVALAGQRGIELEERGTEEEDSKVGKS